MSPSEAAGPVFGLSDEQTLLRDEVRRFAEERIRPGVAERDRTHEFPSDIFQEMASMGLLGMLVAEEYGGAGLDAAHYIVAVEELARVCPSVAVSMSVTNSVCCWPIDRFGSDELKGKVLPGLAGGESLGGFGLTEPESGSDASSLKTTAVREGDFWVLDGEKVWITNAGIADYFVVIARTDPAAGKSGLSAFVVPAASEGVSIGSREEKLGLRASVTASLRFEGCRVPSDNLLGEEGQGWQIVLSTLDHSRLGIAAQAVGIHQRALELAIAYARARVQFGKPIASNQAIRFMIAEMATSLEAARQLTRGAARAESTSDAGRLAAAAKVFAAESANEACWDSLQIHGGNGFSDDYEISKLYRDVRVTTIYEGTSEMQRLVIARHLLRR